MGFHGIKLVKEVFDGPIVGLLAFCKAAFA
jgi:hypothetical protein